MKTCPRCGSKNPDDATNCEVCRTNLLDVQGELTAENISILHARRKRSKKTIAVAIAALLVAIGAGGFWALDNYGHSAEIQIHVYNSHDEYVKVIVSMDDRDITSMNLQPEYNLVSDGRWTCKFSFFQDTMTVNLKAVATWESGGITTDAVTETSTDTKSIVLENDGKYMVELHI